MIPGRRAYRAGTDHIGPHPLPAPLDGDRPGIGDQPCLGRGIGRVAVMAQRIDRGNEHQAPRPALCHHPDDGVGHGIGATQVDRQFAGPDLVIELIERFGDIGFNLYSTLAANVQKSGQGEGVFDRVVISNQPLNKEELQKFREYLVDRGQAMLEEIDNWLTRTVSKKGETQEREEAYETGLAMLQFINWDVDDKTSLREFLVNRGFDADDSD